jgi:hypothetical protein
MDAPWVVSKHPKPDLHTSLCTRIGRGIDSTHSNPAVENPSRPNLPALPFYSPCLYPPFQYPTSQSILPPIAEYSRSINIPLITLQTPRFPLLPNLHTAFTTKLFPTTPRTLARTNKTRPFRTRPAREVIFQIFLAFRRVVADVAGA